MRSIGEDLEATFVAGSHGRDGSLALWGPSLGASDAAERLDLVVPAGKQVRARSVPVQLVPVAELIDTLAALPASTPVTESVRAWSVATRVALDLVARGRLLPTISSEGADTWRLGPLDPADQERVERLAAALPAAAHAIEVPHTSPRQITSPTHAVTAFLDAVADSFVRTPSAAVAAGHAPFASAAPTDVEVWREWLRSTTTGTDGSLTAALRVHMPELAERSVPCILEVHSRIDPGLVVSAVDLWHAPPAVASRFGDDPDLQLLVTLRRAARVWGPISRLLDQALPDVLELDDEEATELFGPVADQLAAAGLQVLWPAEVLRVLDLRPVLTTPRPVSVTAGALNLTTLSEMRWRATLDGEELTDAELDELAEAKRPMVRLRGRWVRADPQQLAKLRERRQVPTGDALAAALTGELVVGGETVEAEIEGPLADLAERLRHLDDRPPFTPPPGLVAELRPYQERGVQWLTEMSELGLGGVLADDMGLGKTIQILTLHLARPGTGPTLIVCPATLLGNWQREAARFAPGVTVHRHHGSGRSLEAVGPGDIVVTTYGLVRRDVDELAAVPWGLVVADEAQAVKNPYSRTARALRDIPASARVALTGTPVENRLSDLWALLDWTTPGLLGTLEQFQRQVAVPIERDRDEAVTERLADTVRPFLLRRRKSDPTIAPDLPEKTETDRFVGLTTEQATLYQAVVSELLDEVEAADGITRHGMVLKLLTALKQICNHPAHYLDQPESPLRGRSGKLDALADLLQIVTDEGDSALVFTQFVRMGELIERHLASMDIGSVFLHGSVPVSRREVMVDAFQDGTPRVLIVSLKAGGTGLNLTRATHVVHYDRWWNPAVEDQASDRAWRIGQDRPVQVHRLVCEGTLEERIAAMLESKRGLAESVVGGGEAWVSELSDAELAALVSLGRSDDGAW
jgi:SNF2 family DNA or RNA helicase